MLGLLAFALTMTLNGSVEGVRPFVQDQGHFVAALNNNGSAPSFILVALMDPQSSFAQERCVVAPFLLYALAIDKGLDPIADLKVLKAIAAASSGHVFQFASRDALSALGAPGHDEMRACEIIRSGMPAYRQDRTGVIVAGQPY